MTATSPSPAEPAVPGGRVELPPGAAVPTGPYVNEDLLPVPIAKRR
jgi:NCS1 family nucleobase:cation symporter-1